jgi:hypothetical protein
METVCTFDIAIFPLANLPLRRAFCHRQSGSLGPFASKWVDQALRKPAGSMRWFAHGLLRMRLNFQEETP